MLRVVWGRHIIHRDTDTSKRTDPGIVLQNQEPRIPLRTHRTVRNLSQRRRRVTMTRETRRVYLTAWSDGHETRLHNFRGRSVSMSERIGALAVVAVDLAHLSAAADEPEWPFECPTPLI